MDIESRALLILRSSYITYLRHGTAVWWDRDRLRARDCAFIVSGRYPA